MFLISTEAIHWCRHIDWGTFPAWVGAIGSSLAFGLALWIYRQNALDRTKDQARQISLVPTESPKSLTDGGTSIGNLRSKVPASLNNLGGGNYEVNGGVTLWHLELLNLSDETVGNVEGEILDADGHEIVQFQSWAVVKPKFDVQFTVASNGVRSPESPYTVRLRFTDAAGRRWLRDHLHPIRKLGKRDLGYQPR